MTTAGQQPPRPCPTLRQAPTDVDEALLSGITQRGKRMIDLQQQLLEHLKPSGDREREAFVDWTRSVILDLDHALWRRCQHEVSATLYRYIAENDALKRQPDPEPSTSTSQQMAPQTPHMWQPHPSFLLNGPATFLCQRSACGSRRTPLLAVAAVWRRPAVHHYPAAVSRATICCKYPFRSLTDTASGFQLQPVPQ